MKILQTVLRRDVIVLRTPSMASHSDARPGKTPSGSVVLENRKMLEFLYEWNANSKTRRMPLKIQDVSD